MIDAIFTVFVLAKERLLSFFVSFVKNKNTQNTFDETFERYSKDHILKLKGDS